MQEDHRLAKAMFEHVGPHPVDGDRRELVQPALDRRMVASERHAQFVRIGVGGGGVGWFGGGVGLAGAGALPPSRLPMLKKALMRSTGTGKRMVEFFSAEISVSVWR